MRQEDTAGRHADAATRGRTRTGTDQPAPPPAPAPAPAPAPRALTEDEIFAKATVDELNKQGVLADAFFALDSVELNQDRAGRSRRTANT